MVNVFHKLIFLERPFQSFTSLPSILTSAACICFGFVGFYRYYWQSRKGANRSLENELVIVTGGCGGIGRQIVEDLSRRKARVLILDIRKPDFEFPQSACFYKVDLTSTQAMTETATSLREIHGDPTVLINNAGVFFHGTILEKSEQALRKTFEVNVISHFILAREFLPAMIRKKSGHIITMASIASFVAVGEMVDYCCSKASALAFHEGLTQELKHFFHAPNVLTTVVHPLWVDTPMIKGFTDHQSVFRQPLMTPESVSKIVVEQIAAREGGQIILPRTLLLASWLRGMPIVLQEMARSFFSKIVYRVRTVRTARN